MKTVFILVGLLALSFLATGQAIIRQSPGSTVHLYVATIGSDSNPGTRSKPFQTILRASQKALPGTIIHVASGIYKGGFQTLASGTTTNRIQYLSDTKWGAKIIPPVRSESLIGWDNRGAYVTIDGFEMDGSIDPISWAKWSVGIGVAGTGDIVTHCLVHHIYNKWIANDNGGAGISLDSWYGYNDMHALGNVVHHVGPTVGGSNWYHGIYQTATGFIKNNVTYANTGGWIHLWHDVHQVDIVNNTSFGNGFGFIVGGGDFVNTTGPCDYINVMNNIAFDNADIWFDEEGECGTHNTFTNNLSFQNGRDWRLEFSKHVSDVSADPQFVNYIATGGWDYHLRRGSPAIDRGSSIRAPLMDFDGKKRPSNRKIDIGAYEYWTR